jgi:hypothetical protein
MATLGITKLIACNEMLLAVGQNRVAALATGGSDDVSEAEYVLDIVTREILMRGFSGNTQRIKITASTAGTIDLSAGATGQVPLSPALAALRVEGEFKHQRRALSLYGSAVWDEDYGSGTCFGANEDVYLKVIISRSFDDIQPDVKELIVAEAKQRYRAMKRPDPVIDGFLERDRVKAETGTGNNDRPPSADAEAVRFGPSAAQPQGRNR